MDISILFNNLEKIDYQELYKMETDIFLSLDCIPDETRPPCVNAFLIISSWFGTSQRSGVWTFYEATKAEKIYSVLQFLKENGDNELAQILEKGMHDYQNPVYAENFDYPEEWIKEADEIDKWIMEHEDWLWKWKYKLLIDNKECLTAI